MLPAGWQPALPGVEAEKFVKSLCRLHGSARQAIDHRALPRPVTVPTVQPMKRFLLVILLGAIAALTAYYIVRQHPAASPSTIANLVSADTALFIHLPDAEKNRDAWHRTDLYQLYREPAVQDF